MIYVMGGGSGGGLAYRLIASATQPANPKDNDIWVKTSINITGVEVLGSVWDGYSSVNGFIQIIADFGGANPGTTGAKSVYNYNAKHRSVPTTQKMTISDIYQTQNGQLKTLDAYRYYAGSEWVQVGQAFYATITVEFKDDCACALYQGSTKIADAGYDSSIQGYSFTVNETGTYKARITKGTKYKESENINITTRGQSETITLRMNTVPQFTYNGTCSLTDDSDNTLSQDESTITDWKITFTSGGDFVFTDLGNAENGIDIHCVGGGAACGGGGYTKTTKNASVSANTTYTVKVGEGGSGSYVAGNPSSFGSLCTAAGGKTVNGGDGGSGAGANAPQAGAGGGNGGSNGGDGGLAGGGGDPGSGQGNPPGTRDFGESSGTLRAGGGGGRSYNDRETRGAGGAGGGGRGGDGGIPSTAGNGTDYYGGGSGKGAGTNQRGGCGIVIIRNKR